MEIKRIGLAAILLTGFAVSAALPQTVNTAAALNAAAIKAYQAKDYTQFLADEKRALALEPGNPRILYNVACGEALQGNARGAVRRLDQLLARKLDLGAEKDADFTGIHSTPDWKEFESKLAELRKPMARSQVAFRLSDPNLLATGIAVDSRTGNTYIASVRERKIVLRTRDGVVSDFIRQGQDGFLAGASLAIDAPRQLLYATTAAVPFMLGYGPADAGQSGIFAFALKSGKLARKILLPADGKQHFLNAMAVDRAGNVYISDSGTPGIYLLRRGSDRLETFIPSDVFRSTQGLAFSRDQKTLYVADWSDGVWAVDMASKRRHHLQAPADVWLGGLDGLSRVGHDLIAVQIGVQPQRVLRLRLDREGRRITQARILEFNRPDYAGPIQGAITRRSFLYVANSQLNLGNPQTGAFTADGARPTVVLRLPL